MQAQERAREQEEAAAIAAAAAKRAEDGASDEDPEEAEMRRLMGFSGFDTSQGREHEDSGAVKRVQDTRRARQYMNRRGGFNRALPAEVTGKKANQW